MTIGYSVCVGGDVCYWYDLLRETGQGRGVTGKCRGVTGKWRGVTENLGLFLF